MPARRPRRRPRTGRRALTASLHWTTLRDVRMQRGRISMTKSILLLIALCFAVPETAMAQNREGLRSLQGAQGPNQNDQGFQSLQGVPDTLLRTERGLQSVITAPRSACQLGSQSVRVCNNDFQSCNSACTSTFISDLADTSGCIQRCCNNFSACLSIRGCANLTSLDCSPTSTNRAIRNLRAQ
jgi:hypothetical protein